MNNPAYGSEIMDYDQVVAYQQQVGLIPEVKAIKVVDEDDFPTGPIVTEAMIDEYLALPWWRRAMAYFGWF